MSKNSTLKLKDLLLKKELAFETFPEKSITSCKLEPKPESINMILAYARSVKGIKTKYSNKILVSLN